MHSVLTTNTWTVCIHFSSTVSVAKLLSRVDNFDKFQRAVLFNQQNKGMDSMPSIAKKRLLRKKYKKQLLSPFQKTKSTQTSGSVFSDKIEQVRKTKTELELTKIADCFIDGHGNYSSNLVSFKIKCL